MRKVETMGNAYLSMALPVLSARRGVAPGLELGRRSSWAESGGGSRQLRRVLPHSATLRLTALLIRLNHLYFNY